MQFGISHEVPVFKWIMHIYRTKYSSQKYLARHQQIEYLNGTYKPHEKVEQN